MFIFIVPIATSSPDGQRYLSPCSLNQRLGYGVEVRLATEQPMQKYQGRIRPLPVKHIIHQIHRAENKTHK